MKLLLILMLTSFAAMADINCDKHPIFCDIKSKRPKMSKSRAMELSNFIYKYSKKYKQDPFLSVAVGMQETTLKHKHRRQNVIVFDKQDPDKWEVVNGYSDLCMFQFHVDTIVNYKLNPVHLRDNLEYCVEQHFILMKKKRKACAHLGQDSWVCYHSVNKIPREYYKSLVTQYLK